MWKAPHPISACFAALCATLALTALTPAPSAAQELTANQPWRRGPKPGPVVFAGKPTDLDPSDPTQATEDTKSPGS